MRRLALALTLFAGAVTAGDALPPASWSSPARYELEYRINIQSDARGRASVWVPYPATNGAQTVLESKVDAPWRWRLKTDKRFGNKILYLEGKAPLKGEIVLKYTVERRPFMGVPPSEAVAGTSLDPGRYMTSDSLVPLEGKIRELAQELEKGRTGAGDKARAFYDYVVRTMTYSKEGTGWGRGDAVWACDSKRGNCTDFHSLFIGMARSAGVPARFVIGFPIPADKMEGAIPGYHCWAEYFDPSRGWRGIDASEAWKKKLPEAYFGTLPNDRIEFTVGRDLTLEPPQKGEPLNYFIYPYAEVDGKSVKDITSSFTFKRIAVELKLSASSSESIPRS